MRYDKTERLGVIAADSIITDKIGWIFREQPIIDVGLDAIIEEVVNDEPTGKFLAVQIKSGQGNFYASEKSLSHYVSNIHYDYWLNLSVPIILIAHLPQKKETYWQLISKENFKKTRKRWKIEIPYSQKLDEKSKSELTSLLSKQNDKNFRIYMGEEDEGGYLLLEDIQCLPEATISINKLSEITRSLNDKAVVFKEKLFSFISEGLSEESPQILSLYKGFGDSIKIISKRTECETEIFSHLYSVGIFTFEKIALKMHYNGLKAVDFGADFSVADNLPFTIKYALDSFLSLKDAMATVSINHPVFKEAKEQYLEVMELLCFELNVAKTITENLVYKIHELKV
ncbi:DUF4365 domain-containing protein [Flavobacterium sp. KACC 22763]|uniref:DUF4365 domain-containing protein n=1 Tax=Flavobacterium sp. KACC 22763 TaxID=3025668 RepID=UPI0023666AD3|nr:DUF4365 domain-containing protein [Flavobacterium sp. KACC 22763]WDF62378.1 DUF4365 domain-containing protein [Flavobacterium sp. KACC 22763]